MCSSMCVCSTALINIYTHIYHGYSSCKWLALKKWKKISYVSYIWVLKLNIWVFSWKNQVMKLIMFEEN